MNAFRVVRDFESALCEYTGASFAVTTTSCTAALMLAAAWHLRNKGAWPVPKDSAYYLQCEQEGRLRVEIPKRTYVGVPYAIRAAGGRPVFRDDDWRGAYQLHPLPVWDSARWLTSGMCVGVSSSASPHVTPFRNLAEQMVCVSFHWSKTLGVQQGGAILHHDPDADAWLRRARFDGRAEGVAPSEDTFPLAEAWHCYMSPEVASAALVRMALLPKHNAPLPNDNYPDLSQLEAFR